MQLKQDTPIPKKAESRSKNVGSCEDNKLTLKEQDIKEDQRNLEEKSLDIKSHAKDGLSRRILPAGLLGSELLLFLKEVRFNNQEFAASIFVSN